nr:TnsD family transposase [Neobacillus soli]
MKTIPNFSSLYPDELLYSIISRYHLWSRNPYFSDTIDDLFGRSNVTISTVLPNRLQQICNKLFIDSNITSKYLIYNHTFYPLFLPFWSKEQNNEILQGMINSEDKSILNRAGILQSKIPFPEYLRFCLKCCNENIELYGEAYWHRTHQIYGVNVCPLHDEILMESSIPFTSKRNRQSLYPLTKQLIKKSIPIMFLKECSKNDLKISKAVYDLLSSDSPVLGLEKLGEKYTSFLKKNGLANYNGTVRKTELLKSFYYFYGNSFLNQMKCNIYKSSNINWIDNLIRPRTNSHPLMHILLINFLGYKLKEFFLAPIDSEKNFGKGPWLCFNAASNHYKEKVITDCKVKLGTQGHLVGTFTCSCGFVYSRRQSDENHDDFYNIGLIKSYGPMWENELIRLRKNEKKTIKEISLLLKVTPLTVIRKLKKFEDKQSDKVKKNSPDNQKQYRLKWLKVVNENPQLNKTGLRSLAKKEFAWLYRQDRKWLEENSPENQRVSNSGKYISWEQRDSEISKLLLDVISEMKSINTTERPIRITIASVGKKIGKYSVILYGLNKMPLTKGVLEEEVESIEEFQMRRVHWAIEVLKEKDDSVTPNKIRKVASLANSKISLAVKHIINIEIDEYYKG